MKNGMRREWKKLVPNIRRCISFYNFRKALLNFIRTSAKKIFNINYQVGIVLLVRLRQGFSHLCKQKFQHNFKNTINPLCSCSTEAKATLHFFFLFCQFFSAIREILMNELALSWRSSLSYRNQSIDLQSKSMDWFLYDRDLRHERVNEYWQFPPVADSKQTSQYAAIVKCYFW